MRKLLYFVFFLMITLLFTATVYSRDDMVHIAQDATLVPSLTATATLQPSLTPTPATALPTPTQIVVTFEPVTGEQIPPPLEVDLPEDWLFGYNTVVSPDVDSSIVPYLVAVYQGRLEEVRATIVLIWGFGSIEGFNPDTGASEVSLFLDGVRLLSPLVIEAECNRGLGQDREFTVGGLVATGATFTAIDCPPPLPDAAGWFAGLQVDGLNFMFYVFVEPAEGLSETVITSLQAIMDTVDFRVDELLGSAESTEEATAEVTPEVTPEATETP